MPVQVTKAHRVYDLTAVRLCRYLAIALSCLQMLAFLACDAGMSSPEGQTATSALNTAAAELPDSDTARLVATQVSSLAVTPRVDTLDAVGASLQLTVTARDGRGRRVSNPNLQWTSLDTNVAKVNRKGKVIMLAAGVATVVVTASSATDTARIVLRDASALSSEGEASLHAVLTVMSDDPGRSVNRRILGNNIEWVWGGNQMLQPGTTQFDPTMLGLASELRPTVLRYPGGSQGDFYHWRDGMGTLKERGSNENFFSREKQRVDFGTAEFLTLSRHLGAEPLITVNAMTGTAQEAAAWVRATNVTRVRAQDGSLLSPVRFWEIDNEPYLTPEGRSELHITPTEYANRANDFIRAMRAVDPSIVVGIPLRSDMLGISPLSQLTMGFADKVLGDVSERFDFVSLHNAYFPFLYDQGAGFNDTDVFRATMAASKVVEQDFMRVRSLLRRYKPGQAIKIGITEYNALFSFEGPRAGYIATLGGALYVADILRVFAEADDVLMANFWGLADNWYFGTFSQQLPLSSQQQPRPAYQVLRAFSEVLRGRIVPVRVEAPTFATAQVGFVPAMSGLPLVTALATTEGNWVRLLVLNKDPSRAARITLQGPARAITAVEMKELADRQIFDVERARGAIQWRTRSLYGSRFPLEIQLEPHSLAWIEVQLGRR